MMKVVTLCLTLIALVSESSAFTRSSRGQTLRTQCTRMALSFPTGGESPAKTLAVMGGTGFVGSEVCRIAVKRGFAVKALSRRGVNPKPDDEYLSQVQYVQGDATDAATVSEFLKNADAIVHAVGLLFDVNSGLKDLNIIVSGSKSVPGEESTYDAVTRVTAYNAINAISKRMANPFQPSKTPFAFVSAAEAGWPNVPLGDQVEEVAPQWLKEYLEAKRSVENELMTNSKLRSIIYRPSLIWNWSKLDVLPVIPIFNAASALGVPFVDKTVRVEALAAAIVAGVEDELIEGVQRFPEIEALSQTM